MNPHDAPSTSSETRAEALFLEFVEGEATGGIEELCRRHPELETPFRELWRDWNWIDDVRALPPTSEAEGIGPRYEVRREIGRGGMGVVLEVWDRELRRLLAVKVSRAAAGGRGHYRFLEEAQVTAQLDHPGIVPIHELGMDDQGQAYFSMRKVQGRTLGDVIELVHTGEAEWTRTRALGVLVQVCETLAFAHSKGVVHRDLKPSNIMVGRFGEVYVMDWGLAKVREPADGTAQPRRSEGSWLTNVTSIRSESGSETSDSPMATLAGSVLGTPAYMPPEQADGRTGDVGAPGDVYAVGAILYHLLAGTPPYAGEFANEGDIVASVRAGPPRPIERAGADVAPELAAICDQAMARDPRERYADIGALASDLRAFLENRVVLAHQTGPVVELRKWVARNRSLATALSAVLVLLVAGLFLQRQQVRQLERANRETAFENYVASVAMASQKVDQSDVQAARRHLEACPPELRNWEWVYQWERCDESTRVFAGAGAHQCDFHPTEPWLAAAAWDGQIWVFETSSSEQVARLDAGGSHAMAVDFTEDGRWLLTTSDSIRAWDTRDWTLAREYANDSLARDLCIEPGGGPRFATSHLDGTVRLWELESKEPIRAIPIHGGAAWSVTWSPDGRRLAATSADGRISVLDPTDGSTLLSFQARRATSVWNGGWEVAFSPDGGRLVNGQPDGALTVWDSETGELRQVLRGHTAQVSLVQFLGDTKLISASFDRSAAIWDLAERRRLRHFRGHERTVNGLALRADGTAIATGSADGTTRLWDLTGAASRPLTIPSSGGTSHALLSPDDSRVVAGGMDGVRVWSARTGQLEFRAGADYSVGAFGADGRELYVARKGSHEIAVFDAVTGEPRPGFQDERAPKQWALAVDPRGRWLASGSDRDLTLWDVETRRMLATHPGRFVAAFHPSADRVAFGGSVGEVILARCPDLSVERVWPVDANHVWEVAFGPRGELLAAGTDVGKVMLWSTTTGALVREIDAHPANVFSLSFAPDGTRLATGSDDKTVKLWDVATGKEVLTLTGPESMVDHVRFSRDGSTLVASSHDSRVRVWRTTGRAADLGVAQRLVAELLPGSATREQAAEALAATPELSPAVREAGLRLIERTGPRHRASNDANWAAVEHAGRPRADYARAVESQRHVCAAHPENAFYLNTLGVGLVRLEEYQEALEVLTRADDRSRAGARPYPVEDDRAYMAICLYELGERERARALVRELLGSRAPDASEAPGAALAEAEARVLGSPGG